MALDLPVIAAIPNYNMAESLAHLLPKVIAQGYDAIYVLDDASTDNSEAVVKHFHPAVTWVPSTKNGGAGVARNKILKAHTEECIIHFLDADVRLESTDVPALARRLISDPAIAMVGGLVKEENGRQSLWNYGPAVAAYNSMTAQIQYWLGTVQAEKPWPRKLLRVLTWRARSEWPDVALPPRRRATHYVIEGNFLIRHSTLAKLGGFDPTIREHDIFPLARAAYQAGLITYFDPSIVTTHTAQQVRGYNRHFARRNAMRYLIRKNGGYWNWWFPEGHFKSRYNKPTFE